MSSLEDDAVLEKDFDTSVWLADMLGATDPCPSKRLPAKSDLEEVVAPASDHLCRIESAVRERKAALSANNLSPADHEQLTLERELLEAVRRLAKFHAAGPSHAKDRRRLRSHLGTAYVCATPKKAIV